MDSEELKKFEKEIEKLYSDSKIKAPVHLSGDNEERIIEIFKEIHHDDWVFSNYRNHYHALLKGIDPKWLKEEIVKGNSMHIMNKKHKFYTSSIVGGQLPIALGVSMALKRKKSKNKVWAFCGDMASETGIFHEVTKYALQDDLPIKFVIEDNGLGVYTPTQEVWGNKKNSQRLETILYSDDNQVSLNPKIIRYKYNRAWPHHGIGLWVDFQDQHHLEATEISYKDEIKKSMDHLARDERTLFLGQTVGFKGSVVYETLKDVPKEKKIELPVMEEAQMGISIGLALEKYIPISIYPRFDFLILATNQLVNHLDKTKELSNGQFDPKVIIRTMVGSKQPFYPGPQHCQDHTEAYKSMLTNTKVVKINKGEEVFSKYDDALRGERSSLVIELADKYR